MRQYLIFAIFLFGLTTNAFNQTISSIETKANRTSENRSAQLLNDTIPTVILKTTKSNLTPLYYINGVQRNSAFLRTVNPNLIESISVVKNEKQIGDTNHSGSIYIEMKKEYSPHLISLTDLKLKYANEEKMSTIYMIDNDIIKENYSDCLVDEKYILKIIIDTFENKKENFNVQVIQLVTRTDENIKNQSNKIKIRGNDE